MERMSINNFSTSFPTKRRKHVSRECEVREVVKIRGITTYIQTDQQAVTESK